MDTRLLVDLESNADLSKLHDEKTERLRRMTVLFLDEASMMDDRVWFAIKDQLTTMAEAPLEEAGGKHHPDKDVFGRVHLMINCDFKQLPPATSRPPFLAADNDVLQQFRFRMLRQNRRIISSSDPEKQAQLEEFHGILEDIAFGRPTSAVRRSRGNRFSYCRSVVVAGASFSWRSQVNVVTL